MELRSVRIDEAPSGKGRVRLVGDVVYIDRPGRVEKYWFEVSEKYADSLSQSGNPWLACLLPLAVTLGEPLRLCRPVDPVLRANVERLMRIWSAWYPYLRPVAVEAEAKVSAQPRARLAGALFSGGVDSFFTVLRNLDEPDREAFPLIQRLLFVWGIDLSLSAAAAFDPLRSRLAAAASDLGKDFVDIITNLRVVRFREAPWGPLAHGGALASVGLLFERELSAVYVAATNPEGLLVPWGSHPETDPLLSTSSTQVIHYGADAGRSAKTEFISRSDVAMRSLHVCFRSGSADNCGACRKCYLTMLNLQVVGALSRCETLPRNGIDLDRVRRIYTEHEANDRIFRDIESRARAAGMEGIAAALADCLDRSRKLRRVLGLLRRFESKRGLWRVARPLRLAMLARAIR